MLDEAEYLKLAERELNALVKSIDQLGHGTLDCELSEGILTLEFDDDDSYVINSHRAAKQIWMAANRKAWHFDWNEAAHSWIARKNGDELWTTVSQLLEDKLKMTTSLSRPPF